MSCPKKHSEFFGHERSDLALQNDDFLMDPVIFDVVPRHPRVCNDPSNDLDFSISGQNQ